MPDHFELAHACLDVDRADGATDDDTDGLSAVAEYARLTDPCDMDSDDDAVKDRVEVDYSETDPLDADSDDDGTGDRDESFGGCGLAGYDLSKGDGVELRIGFGDFTHPAHGGVDPLDCDADQDNDGRPDGDEVTGVGCGGIATWPGGAANISVDDDHDGNPASGIYFGSDPSDDGVSWDTDGDGQLDGFECAHGLDPVDALSRDAGIPNGGLCGSPLASPPVIANEWAGSPDYDADNDGLQDGWERCKWGTNPLVADTDGDGVSDCREAADVDGTGVPTIADAVIIAKSAQLAGVGFGKDWIYDFDGRGSINIADAVLVAQLATIGFGVFCDA
jgi:hypothetical protein